MRTSLLLASALALFPTLTLAGPHDAGRAQNHRVHFATGIRWAHSAHRFVYQGQEVSDYVYPYAIPTSNPDIVISPFALNNLVDVTGIPSGARVRDPVSEEIFLRP